MSWKTFFNPDWVNGNKNPQWADWIESVPGSPNEARCRLCMKTFSLSNMGRQALSSHEQSGKHQKLIANRRQNSIVNCLKIEKGAAKNDNIVNASSNSAAPHSSNWAAKSADANMSNFVAKEEVQTAEILWAMKLIMSHSSYNSFKDAAELFQCMFADSEIAKKITIGSSKMAYLIAFGLAPYFKKELRSEIKDNDFVICMDEALNRVAQKGQMDLIVRFWPENSSEIHVRYFTSVFLGHSTAEDLYANFCKGVAELDLKNLLQLSLDGPNVNLKFLRHLTQELKENTGHELLSIGTCSLHIIHGAFQRGNKKTDWKLNEIFSSLYRFFKDSPARRSDFIRITGSELFPLKFCHIRWVENVSVAERAIVVFPNVVKYFNAEKKNLPQNMSSSTLQEALSDKLILAKMAFFSSIANILEPFLKEFQSPKPLVPFMYNALSDVLRQIMSKFIKSNLLDDGKTLSELFQIDVALAKNQRRHVDVDIGIGARSFVSKSGASEAEKNSFLVECKGFLSEMCSKIFEKFAAKFSVLRSLSCLNPITIRSNPSICEKRMDSLLLSINNCNRISVVTLDRAKQQFNAFLSKAQTELKVSFLSFSKEKDRLDVFYSSLFSGKDEFKDLWKIVKLTLILSHGNASVESGFSINKDMLVENLSETSLIAQRTVYDYVKTKGGVTNININAELLQYAKMSRSRYHLALEEKKTLEKAEKRKIDEKQKLKDQVKSLKLKKAKLSSDIAAEKQKIEEEIRELEKKCSSL